MFSSTLIIMWVYAFNELRITFFSLHSFRTSIYVRSIMYVPGATNSRIKMRTVKSFADASYVTTKNGLTGLNLACAGFIPGKNV
jgi:hypothetical protein